jgi:hypothetical protein
MNDGHDEDNGTEPTAEQMQQMVQQALEMTAVQTSAILEQLAPHLNDELRAELGGIVAQEQFGPIDQQILPTLFGPMAESHPTLVCLISEAKKKGDEARQVQLRAPKSLNDVADPQTAAQSAVLIALLLCPPARALLKAFGFSYQFAQSDAAAEGKIIMPH